MRKPPVSFSVALFSALCACSFLTTNSAFAQEKRVSAPSLPGMEPAVQMELGLLADSGILDDKADVVWRIGVAHARERPVWVQLRFPPFQPSVSRIAGRVEKSDGSEVRTFKTRPETLLGDDSTIYQASLPLGPGTYHLEIVAIGKGKPLVVAKTAIDVPSVEPNQCDVVGPYITNLVQQRKHVVLGAPFSFGILQISPLGGMAIDASEQLAYFGFVTDSSGVKPSLKGQLAIFRGEERVQEPLSLDLRLAQPPVSRAEGLWIFTAPLKLSGLPGGEYKLDFRLLVAGHQLEHRETIHIAVRKGEGTSPVVSISEKTQSRASSGPLTASGIATRVVQTVGSFKKVSWKSEVHNSSTEAQQCNVVFRWFDSDGFEIHQDKEFKVLIPANSKVTVTGTTMMEAALVDQIAKVGVKLEAR